MAAVSVFESKKKNSMAWSPNLVIGSGLSIPISGYKMVGRLHSARPIGRQYKLYSIFSTPALAYIVSQWLCIYYIVFLYCSIAIMMSLS